jgi:hypothetical protein
VFQRFFDVGAQIQQLIEGFVNGALSVVLLEGLLPLISELRDFRERL